MSPEVISSLALVAIFAIATVLPIDMGALAFVAASGVDTLAVGLTTDDIIAGFPGQLVLTLVVALAVASTIVDVSPFSTNGALVLARAQDVDRDRFYKQIRGYSGIVVLVGPLLAWLVFVVPGWL